MSRQTDLERSIRESYNLIREYEDILRLSDRPKEKLRARREIEEQWGLIEGYLGEYMPLAGEDVPGEVEPILRRAQSWRADLERLSAPALLGSREERRVYRNRQLMIERVRNSWIKGVLEQSLYRVARIELGLQEQPDAVERPWEMLVQEQGYVSRELPQGARMSEVFDELHGALLILGAPGSGKTTLLLELASDLLDRAETDTDHPIPVVFNLSSWAAQRKPLADWLVDELNERYDVPRRIGRVWVEDDQVLLLLDGLDEVAEAHRQACVGAINAYREGHGWVPMVVCSRLHEYEGLPARLRLGSALLVQPLKPDQVDAYLARAGEPLLAVRQALQHDPVLEELTRTPLMLSIVLLAYHGLQAQELDAFGTVEVRREHIFATYIQRMFERRGGQPPCSPQCTRHWLAWLANQLSGRTQSEFLIERLQPDWLPARGQQQAVRWAPLIASGLIIGLLVGLGFGLGLMQDYARGWRPESDLSQGLYGWLGRSLGYGAGLVLAYGLIYALISGLLYVLLVWLFGCARSIRPVETLHWARHRARAELGFGWIGGLVLGLAHGLLGITFEVRAGQDPELLAAYSQRIVVLVGGLLGGLAVWLIRSGWIARSGRDKRGRWSAQSALIYGLSFATFGILVNSLVSVLDPVLIGVLVPTLSGALGPGSIGTAARLVYGLASALVGGPLGALLIGLFGGLVQGEMATRVLPNEGIRRSARNAWRTGWVSGTTCGVLAGTLAGLDYGIKFGLGSGLLAGLSNGLFSTLIVGLGGGLLYGGIPCLQHLLLRVLLWRDGLAPWAYAQFLDYATERILLRKVGGGYIFIHRLLQDYFAGLWERE